MNETFIINETSKVLKSPASAYYGPVCLQRGNKFLNTPQAPGTILVKRISSKLSLMRQM